jgi:hypothetical protein
LLALAVVSSSVRAAADPDPASVDEAKRLYAEAHGHFVAGRCADAMPLLLQANKLVPSPNSGLLIARCLVTENKLVPAANRYTEVERDALNLVRTGETRYGETAAAAAKEGSALRAQLGTLRVRLQPRTGVSLEVDGAPTEIQGDGETTLLHEPGQAKVSFVVAASRRDRNVSIAAGKESLLVYTPEESRPAPPPPTPSKPKWPWALYGAAGVSIAGFATLAVFGLSSEATYKRLESRCGSSCTAADRPAADQGRAFQTVANIGLAVGLVFAAVTVVALSTR